APIPPLAAGPTQEADSLAMANKSGITVAIDLRHTTAQSRTWQNLALALISLRRPEEQRMLAHFIGAGSDQVGERSNGQAPSAWGFRKLQSLTMSWLVLGTFGPAGDLPLRRKLMPGDLCKKNLSSCSTRKPYERTPLLFGRLE